VLILVVLRLCSLAPSITTPLYMITVFQALRGRGFLSQGESNFRRLTYQEDKRCMLVLMKLAADFSRGCAGKRIGFSLFATHPTLAFANGSMPVIPPVIRAAANRFIHCCYILCLAISCRVENGLFSVHIGVGLCRIVDMNVGEFTF
jgi:hypothetical protein